MKYYYGLSDGKTGSFIANNDEEAIEYAQQFSNIHSCSDENGEHIIRNKKVKDGIFYKTRKP